VVVALGATYGEAEPDRAGRSGAVDQLFEAGFGAIHASFPIGQGVPIESGGNFLFHGRVRKLVARDLLNGEFIVRHVPIQGVDNPLAVAPRIGANQILFVAIAIGIMGEVEPVPRPLLAVMRRIKQAVHHALIGIGTLVVQERRGLFKSGGQAGEIETHPAEQRRRSGRRGRRNALAFQTGENEPVDCIGRPGAVMHGGRVRMLNRTERPMRRIDGLGPFRALIDPRFQERDLLGREAVADWRHDLRPGARNHGDHPACGTIARLDDPQSRRAAVQTQAARLHIGTVTEDAALLEDGLNVAGEIDGRLRQTHYRS